MIADLDSLGSKKLTYKYLYKFEFAQLSFMISQSQYPVFKVQCALCQTMQCLCGARNYYTRNNRQCVREFKSSRHRHNQGGNPSIIGDVLQLYRYYKLVFYNFERQMRCGRLRKQKQFYINISKPTPCFFIICTYFRNNSYGAEFVSLYLPYRGQHISKAYFGQARMLRVRAHFFRLDQALQHKYELQAAYAKDAA